MGTQINSGSNSDMGAKRLGLWSLRGLAKVGGGTGYLAISLILDAVAQGPIRSTR
jgi:hypothetical protein